MSSRSLRAFISQEDLAAPIVPAGMDATEIVDPGQSDDAPLFVLHGAKGDEPWVSDLKSAMIDQDALGFANDQAKPAVESQQLDEAAQAAAEEQATKLAELNAEADAVMGRQKVFVLGGKIEGDESTDDMHKTFSALAKSALDDPYNTVAAFLPVDSSVNNPELARETDELQHMLREEGVPYVTSVEALAEHLNFVLEGRMTLSTEGGAKPLRPGMRVRYSHGHGKIQKILTSPMKVAGKVHHATKDKPLYVVKADKGGHVSIHKASALTAV